MNWQQVCKSQELQNLPYKIELNRQGQIIMSPASVKHVLFQGKIIELLNTLGVAGLVVPEFPVATHDGVKVADVALLTLDQVALVGEHIASSIAPLLCIEVLSPSNTLLEMEHKKELYFTQGAEEFWLCDESGILSFYDKKGQLCHSKLVIDFPLKLELLIN